MTWIFFLCWWLRVFLCLRSVRRASYFFKMMTINSSAMLFPLVDEGDMGAAKLFGHRRRSSVKDMCLVTV